MVLKRVLEQSKYLAQSVTQPGDIAIDCTCGNGNDTLYLAELVGSKGRVYGFDIQEQALNNTKELLKSHEIKHVELIQDGHEHVADYVDEAYKGKVSCAMFNLGYLPKGDKEITTKGETTLQAIEALFPLLRVNGLIILVVYSGHEEGQAEMEDLLSYVKGIDQKVAQVLMYRFLNQRNHAPFIIAIEKVKLIENN